MKLGVINKNSAGQVRSVARAIKHPQYKPPEKYHDIALIKMSSPVKFTAHIRPACLNSHPISQSKALASGFGKNSHGMSKLCFCLCCLIWLQSNEARNCARVTINKVIEQPNDHYTNDSHLDCNTRQMWLSVFWYVWFFYSEYACCTNDFLFPDQLVERRKGKIPI